MWLGCRAGLVVGIVDKEEDGMKEDVCHWSIKTYQNLCGRFC